MELLEVIKAIFQYGGTLIMAALFVWVFIQDKTKNNKMLEDNTQMLKVLTESNNNIAKSLDIIASNLVTIDSKVDRNYQELLKERRK
ncbi:MAG: hypothetical protein ACLU07_01605 [Lachnospirales bacterium]|jgi:hypothetical protein|nr:MAG TPA: hypothetical protein [Caudoviricetes sp.]